MVISNYFIQAFLSITLEKKLKAILTPCYASENHVSKDCAKILKLFDLILTIIAPRAKNESGFLKLELTKTKFRARTNNAMPDHRVRFHSNSFRIPPVVLEILARKSQKSSFRRLVKPIPSCTTRGCVLSLCKVSF